MVQLTLLAATTIGIVMVRNLFAVAILTGVYSFLMASVLLVLDAVDVAMTEATVGAGIATVLMLGTLSLTKTDEDRPRNSVILPLFVAIVTGAALVWGMSGLPDFGIAETPLHLLGPDYLARSLPQTGIPNVVTSVLASYRGFDTLGEVMVIFTGGIAVLILLKRSPKKRPGPGPESGPGPGPESRPGPESGKRGE
jgi:multicomponent Na+:H+ antiporter subunit B